MDSLFTQTSVVLTSEFVKLFTPHQLASKLSKVRSLTGAQFSKAKKTYALVGSWEQINSAFKILQSCVDNHEDESIENDVVIKGHEQTSIEKHSCSKNGVSLSAASVAADDEVEEDGDVDLLKQAMIAGGIDENFENAAENVDRGTETVVIEKQEVKSLLKKQGKVHLGKTTQKRVQKNVDNVKTPKKSKENKPNIKKVTERKSLKKRGKDKALSEVNKTNGTVSHKQSSDQTIVNINGTVTTEAEVQKLHQYYTTKPSPSSSDIIIEPLATEEDSDASIKGNEHGEENSIDITDSENGKEIKDTEKGSKRSTRKPGDAGYWSRVKILDYNEKHKCSKCDVVLKSRKRYMEHMRRIHIKDFKCDVCERRFGYPTDLHRHKCPGVPDPNNEQKGKGGRPKKPKSEQPIFIPCPECDYIGTSKKRFNGHVRRTHRLTYACDQCEKMFGFLRDLQRHKENVHSEPSHFCDKCSRFYKSKVVFDVHMKTHEDGYIKPKFECQVCAKSFTTKYVLASHIKTEHLGMKKTYLCQICGKKFSQRNSYKQHSNAHNGIKPYKCDLCGKAFTYHKSLKEHKFMHDNIRRFQCHLCDKAFRQRTTLQIHMKVHKTIKDHICETCGKGFSQKQALERHERIHTGVKPYTCVPCQRTFGDASTIRRHMLAIHQKDETNWREDIICSVKKKTDYYVLGGSGQNRTYNRVKSNSIQPPKTKNKVKKTTSQEADLASEQSSIVLINTQDQCSLEYKNEYSLSDLSALQEQTGQLSTLQPGAIYAVSTGMQQQLQNAVTPLTVNINNNGTQNVLDFSTLSQTASQPQLLEEKDAGTCGDQSHLDIQTTCTNGLQNAQLAESQRTVQINGVQSSSGDSALSQSMSSIWGFVGYPAYYNAATLTQFQASQNQQ